MHATLDPQSTDVEWRTARLVKPTYARPIINRLDAYDFEYKVLWSDRELRILVPQNDLEEVLLMLSDFDPASMKDNEDAKRREVLSHRLLIAIPIGALAGTLISMALNAASPTWACVGAGVACLVASLIPFKIGQ